MVGLIVCSILCVGFLIGFLVGHTAGWSEGYDYANFNEKYKGSGIIDNMGIPL